MGMHRDGTNLEFDPIERNTRRQVWWSIYFFERTLCSVLGCPTVIDDSEILMRAPDAPLLEQKSPSAEFMSHSFELVRLSYKIRQRAYFDPRTAEERSPTLGVASSLLRECDEFFSKVPRNLSIDYAPVPRDQRARILLLHIYYYYTRCVVTRDFLIQKVERNVSYLENRSPPTSEDWQTTLVLGEDCVQSAHMSLRYMMAGVDLGLIDYSWLGFFFVFHSVLIVCADFLARPREQQESSKDGERKAMVRAVLEHVRGMRKLAPTYSILSRIACQFAAMTGVCDESATAIRQTVDPSLDSTSSAEDENIGITDILLQEDWFVSATTSLGMDFLDLDPTAGSEATPVSTTGHAYTGYSDSNAGEVDDWTTKALKGMHSM